MQHTDQRKSPVKYELLTPLGDEDIADRREIAEINTFRNRIVTDPGIDSDPGSYVEILGKSFGKFIWDFIGNLALIYINVWSSGLILECQSHRKISPQ